MELNIGFGFSGFLFLLLEFTGPSSVFLGGRVCSIWQVPLSQKVRVRVCDASSRELPHGIYFANWGALVDATP